LNPVEEVKKEQQSADDPCEEEDTCVPYEEEDTCINSKAQTTPVPRFSAGRVVGE
jgi:hypothetical protein